MMLKIIYMTTTAQPGVALLNYLQSSNAIELCGVVVETTTKVERIKQLFKNKNLFKKIDIAAFRFLHRFLPNDVISYEGSDYLNIDLPRLVTDNINQYTVIEFINKYDPDLVLLKGVSIIGRDYIKAINQAIVNIHSGWLPDYRGVQCGTWAVVNNDFHKIGITFHFVDQGIDTGSIILKGIIDPEFLTTISMLNIHREIENQQFKMIVNLFDEFINKYPGTAPGSSDTQPLKLNKPYSFVGLSDFITAILNVSRFKNIKRKVNR